MTIQLVPELTNAVESQTAQSFESLGSLARSICPAVRISVSKSSGQNETDITLSFLHDPAGEEVAVAIALVLREGTLWCELTLYVGQRTHLNMAWSGWSKEEPLTSQVPKRVGEFLKFAEPDIVSAFSDLVRNDII